MQRQCWHNHRMNRLRTAARVSKGPAQTPCARRNARGAGRLAAALLLLAALGSALAGAAGLSAEEALAVPYRFGDVQRWAPIFENPQRDRYQMPERVIASLGLAPGAVVADVGAATGYFARRFARVLGHAGHVFAVDIEPALLTYLDARARSEGIRNLQTVTATPTDSHLPAACCDLIFLCNTYHMIGPRVDYLSHLQDKLKPGGRIAIIDWRKQPLPRGPKPEWKLTAAQVAQEAARAGLCSVDRPDFLPYQYFFILRPCLAG
jgi:SAM-dependent methyltransferase